MIQVGICNSSPLIALSRISRLDILKCQVENMLIPHMVAEEVGDIPEWIQVQELSHPRTIDMFPSNIHKGEAEVIALGLQHTNAVLILDDWYAREYAKKRGFAVLGTVGLIIRAKRQGNLITGMPLLNMLQSVGFRLSNEVLN